MIKTITPEQSKRRIPIEAPAASLQSCSTTIQLRTRPRDMIEVDKSSKKLCNEIIATGLKELKQINLEKELQSFKIPEMNENIIDTSIEMIWEFYKLDGTEDLCWCTGSVIGLKGGNKVVVEWDDKRENTEEELRRFKYSKPNVKAWRLCVKEKITKSINQKI